jgi:hypothetical protein
MASPSERMRILQMIEDGQVSAADGLKLLDALGADAAAASVDETTPPADSAAPARPGQPAANPDLDYWRRWWIVPMWAGIGVLLVGALLMFAAYQAGGFGFWFVCAALPFAAGVLIMALAAGSRSARWLHVRVRANQSAHDWPRNIALSFPLPIRLTAGLLRLVGPFIPALKDHGLDELILALAETTSSEAPLYVDVDEGEGGERVQVYIG